MSDPTTPEPQRYLTEGRADYDGWNSEDLVTEILERDVAIDRLEGTNALLNDAKRMYQAEITRLEGEVERLRGDLRDALDTAAVRRCRECHRLGLREPYCCVHCGADPSDTNKGVTT